MKTFNKKVFILFFLKLLFFLNLSKANPGQDIDSANQYFKNYVKLYVYGYVMCPTPDNGPLKNTLQSSFIWYHNKSQENDKEAQYLIGIAYMAGLGVQIDNDKAEKWIYKSALQGYAPAEAGYGFLLMQSPIKNKSSQAIIWFKKAAQQKNIAGEFGMAYDNISKENYKDGINLMIELANKNNLLAAQEILGIAYGHGMGVSENYKKALFWFKKALDHRPMPANSKFIIENIILIYSMPGVTHDIDQVAYWDKRLKSYKPCDE